MENRFKVITVALLTVCVTLTYGAENVEKNAAVAIVDPKQAAEDARFKWVDKKYRAALLELEKADFKLMDSWVGLQQGRADMVTLADTWGTKTRKEAEKRAEKLRVELPKLQEVFAKRFERQMKLIDKEIDSKRKEAEKVATWVSRTTVRLDAARAEVAHSENVKSALSAMESSLSEYRGGKDVDRLQQIGIPKSDSLRKSLTEYSKIIESAFTIKDIKADIAELGIRQKEGKTWNQSGENALKAAQTSLEREGKKIEALVAQELKTVSGTIEKLNREIKELESKIEKLPTHSSVEDRLLKKKWEFEAELFKVQGRSDTFSKLIKWKDPEPKGAVKEAKK